MITFEEAWEIADTVGIWVTFQRAEAEWFWDALIHLPDNSSILEVGCEYGRSTSLIMQASEGKHHRITLIDPFVTDGSGPKFMKTMLNFRVPFTLHCMEVKDAPLTDDLELDFVHIDGNHSEPYIRIDCERLLWRVRGGGVLFVHDYDQCGGWPDVKRVFDECVCPEQWEFLGCRTSLAKWRKL